MSLILRNDVIQPKRNNGSKLFVFIDIMCNYIGKNYIWTH